MTGQRQTCKACLNQDGFNFHVPDSIWNASVPAELRNRVVCLSCFDRFAHDRGVDYKPHIHTLYFAGELACFEFRVVSRASIVSSLSLAFIAKFATAWLAVAAVVVARGPV